MRMSGYKQGGQHLRLVQGAAAPVAPAGQTYWSPPVGDPDTPNYPPHVCTPGELARNGYTVAQPDQAYVAPPSQVADNWAPADPWAAPKGDPDSYTAGTPVTYSNPYTGYDAGPFMAARAIRPAGSLYDSVFSSVDAEGNPRVAPTPPADPAARENERRALDLAAAALGRTGDAIVAAIEAGNDQELARINTASRERIAEIDAQIRGSTNAQELARLQSELNAQRQIASITASSNQAQQNTILYAGLAVGAVVLIGGGLAVYMATRPRSNPGRRAGGR